MLAAGGSALDAVCATVEQLEDDPLFNAGRGAALTAAGTAELDACVMTGDGRAGAITACRHARNPVHAARKVMEETPAVLLVAPTEAAAARLGARDRAAGVLPHPGPPAAAAQRAGPARWRPPGTARSARWRSTPHGRLAAATSTGGMVNQNEGRVGDTPIVGAGTYARDGVVAISCTGEGEAFIKGVVAHDIAARDALPRAAARRTAVTATVEEELTRHGAMGGLIAVGADGTDHRRAQLPGDVLRLLTTARRLVTHT